MSLTVAQVKKRDKRSSDTLKQFKKRISASFSKLSVSKENVVTKDDLSCDNESYAPLVPNHRHTRSLSSTNLAQNLMNYSCDTACSSTLDSKPHHSRQKHSTKISADSNSSFSTTNANHEESISSVSDSQQKKNPSSSSKFFHNLLRRVPSSKVKRHNSLGNMNSLHSTFSTNHLNSSFSFTNQPDVSAISPTRKSPPNTKAKEEAKLLACQHVSLPQNNSTDYSCRMLAPCVTELPPCASTHTVLANKRPKSDGNIRASLLINNNAGGSMSKSVTGGKVSNGRFGRSESYHKLDILGEGSYAAVFRGFSRLTNQVVALKEIKIQPDEGTPFTAIREASLLKGLRHANIVTLHDIIHTKESLTFVFEFVHSDLSKYIERHPHGIKANNIKLFLFQLLRGLAFCHSRQILHRDLKPQNLLISDHGDLKLADFGLARAKSVPSKTYSNEVVTLWYRPPDVLLGSTTYDGTLDIWGVGCIFTEMVSGVATFPGLKDAKDQLEKITKTMGTPTEDTWPGVSKLPNYKSLISRNRMHQPRPLSKVVPRLLCIPKAEDMAISLLHLRPEERPSSVKAMQHPYFENLPQQIFTLPPSSSIFTVPGVYFETECVMPLASSSPSSTLHQHAQCICDPYLASPPHSGSQHDDSGVMMIDDDAVSTPTSHLHHSFSQTFPHSYHQCPSSQQLQLSTHPGPTIAAQSSAMSRSMIESIPSDTASSTGGVLCSSDSLRFSSMTRSFHSCSSQVHQPPPYQNKYSVKYLKQAVYPSTHIKMSNSFSKESFIKQFEQHNHTYCQPHVKNVNHKTKARSSSTEYCPTVYSSNVRGSGNKTQNISLSSAKSFDNYRV